MSILKATAEELATAIAETRAKQAMLRKYRAKVNRVIAPLVAAHKAGTLKYQPNVSITGKDTDWWHATFSSYVTTISLDGFKDERLMKLLGKLIASADKTETKDYPESLNRDYRFTFRISETADVEVCVQAYVRSDSPTCRRVEKARHTEVVERVEYEMVCE